MDQDTDRDQPGNEAVGPLEAAADGTVGERGSPFQHPCRTCDRQMPCHSPSMCAEGRYLCIGCACINKNERDLESSS